MTEYRVNVINPITKEIIACDNVPISKLENFSYSEREDYLIGTAMEMIKDDSIVRNSDFENIETYVNYLNGESLETIEEIYDYIQYMPTYTCFISDSVNPDTESKAGNPIIMITTITYTTAEDEENENENPIIGYAVQLYNSTIGCYITQSIYPTYEQAQENMTENCRIIDVSYGQSLT